MSAKSYTNINDLIKSVVDSYMETGEIAVIIDVHASMPFLEGLLGCKVNNTEFYIESYCNDSLFDDLKQAEESDEPFMISVMEDGLVVTERFHSEYKQGAYEDFWYFIDEKYADCIGNLNPSYFSLFKIDFDPFEMT